jgi:hypothetical protein
MLADSYRVLPYTVDGLISDGGIIDPNTYNSLQLGMIAKSHGSQELIIPASAFLATVPTSFYANPAVPIPEFSGDSYNFAAGISVGIRAPIMLPVGTLIETLRYRFNKNGRAAAITFALKKKSISAAATNVNLMSDASAGVVNIESSVTVNYLIESGFGISIGVNAGHVDHVFESATVIYSKPI